MLACVDAGLPLAPACVHERPALVRERPWKRNFGRCMSARPDSDAPSPSQGNSKAFSPEAKASSGEPMSEDPIVEPRTEPSLPPELIDFDPAWIAVQRQVQAVYGKKPDLNALLLLIGVQETGQTDIRFTKEQKQDLMHVAVCTLLSAEGHYRPLGRDADGWPHFESLDNIPPMTVEEQEVMLKRCVIRYFNAP
jgi:hypothetical protein